VLPEQIAIAEASQAFDESGGLKDARQQGFLRASLTRLIAFAESEL